MRFVGGKDCDSKDEFLNSVEKVPRVFYLCPSRADDYGQPGNSGGSIPGCLSEYLLTECPHMKIIDIE